jgi:DNA-directed RNA polymerase subunit RPC12/RpoP
MKCPECKDRFALTWLRYAKAPLGRISCPSCGARLVLKHRWFYWPAMLLGCALVCTAFLALGDRLTGSIVVTVLGATLGGLSLVLPADKYLEAHFSVLAPVSKAKATALADEAAPVPAGAAVLETETEQD